MPDSPVQHPALVRLDDLPKYAADLWSELAPGACVWLSGDIGSGKTTFARALTECANTSPARSPTFALVHEYAALEGPIVHVDCYRLRDPDEAIDLDLSELQRTARLLLIEWPERAGRHAPPPDVHLHFAHAEGAHARWLQRTA